MSVERILVLITESGGRVVQSSIQGIGRAAQQSATDVDRLNGALKTIGVGLGIKQVADWSDTWTMAGSRIRSVTRDSQEQLTVQERLYRIANQTTTSFKETVSVYTDLARSIKELGVSQEQVLRFTELTNKTLAIHGTNAATAKGALLQLGQAMTMGRVRAQEWNSMIAGMPGLLRAAAENIQGMDGSLAKLRQRMLAGQFTSKEFFDAVLKGGAHIDESFSRFQPTFGRAITVLENYAVKLAGMFNESTGAARLFTSAVLAIGEHLPEVSAALVGIAAAAAIAFAPAVIGAFTAAVVALGAVIMAHPLAAIVGLGVAIYQLYKDANAGLDSLTIVADVVASAWETVKGAISEVWSIVTGFFGSVAGMSSKIWGSITNSLDSASGNWTTTFSDFFNGVGTGFSGILVGVARVFDRVGAIIYAWWNATIQVFRGLPDLIAEVFSRAFNGAIEHMESFVNMFIGAYNKLANMTNGQPIELVQFGRLDENKAALTDYLEAIKQAAVEGFNFQGGALESVVNNVLSRAQQIAKNRKSSGPVGLNDKTTGTAVIDEDKKLAREKERNLNALNSLYGMLGKVEDATSKYVKAEKTLYDAERLGNITHEERVDLIKKLIEWYLKASDPVGVFIQNLRDENALMGLNAEQRQLEIKLLETKQRFEKEGIKVSAEKLLQLREEIALNQEALRVAQIRDQLEAGSRQGQAKDFGRNVDATKQLVDSGKMDKSEAATTLAAKGGLDISNTPEYFQNQQKAAEQQYAYIEKLRQKDLVSERTASIMKQRVELQMWQSRLSTATTFFGNLAQMQTSKNKTFARIGKAAAIAQATIQTYNAATSAYAAMASIPYVGPALGAAAAAAAIVAGMANVQAIRSQNTEGYKSGGYTGNGGVDDIAGVVHGQEFVVNAEGTKKNRAVLEQMNKGITPAGSGVNVNIENYGTGKDFEVQQISATDIRIIARDEAKRAVYDYAPTAVASDIRNPNSETSRSISRYTNSQRRR